LPDISPIIDPSSASFQLGGKPVHGSKAVRLSGEFSLVYTSGLVAPKEGERRGPIEAQVRSVLEQLRDLAGAAGTDLGGVVKLMAWLPRREDVVVYAEVRREYFGEASPASTSVIGELVEDDILIEIEAVIAVA
jgi:2-iminobutanoate/2-iminopropanoate deaminase